ncbi:hypothetical protein BCV71DRAFT_186797 [Rhizopus microsporus]|uniref:Uncharacterized protein n=1 Tax=Rhizopus microsporus TaxID=58291 RepID=A0A1X0RS24_RHIZD|nr:hypothetical protein BCV71DRAFT_186797 [Rhizopus microsporus]
MFTRPHAVECLHMHHRLYLPLPTPCPLPFYLISSLRVLEYLQIYRLLVDRLFHSF